MGPESNYLLAVVQFDGSSFVTWASNYKFDPEKEEITLYDHYGGKLSAYTFPNKIKQIDIYDVSNRVENQAPIQTILGRKGD